jgi:hypothetical protein
MELFTMATHALPSRHILDDDDDAPQAAAPPAISLKPSLMRRFYDGLVETQSKRAQREIDRVLGRGAYHRAMGTPPPER